MLTPWPTVSAEENNTPAEPSGFPAMKKPGTRRTWSPLPKSKRKMIPNCHERRLSLTLVFFLLVIFILSHCLLAICTGYVVPRHDCTTWLWFWQRPFFFLFFVLSRNDTTVATTSIVRFRRSGLKRRMLIWKEEWISKSGSYIPARITSILGAGQSLESPMRKTYYYQPL